MASRLTHYSIAGLAVGSLAALAITLPIQVPSDLPFPYAETESSSPTKKVETRVTRVIDGDTVAVNPVEGTDVTTAEGRDEAVVRLLGIDAPEMNSTSPDEPECGAKDATRRLTSALEPGTKVTVVYDAAGDSTDRFGRSLAYLEYTNKDGEVVDAGEKLVADGFVAAWYPTSAVEPERFEDYEKLQEKAQGRGNWPVCDDLGR